MQKSYESQEIKNKFTKVADEDNLLASQRTSSFKTLSRFFQESPLVGANLDLNRDPSAVSVVFDCHLSLSATG
jgi:hypothetical protein